MKQKSSLQPNNTEMIRWLGNCTSLPRKYLEEILLQSEINTKYANLLSDNDIEIIYEKTTEITNKIINEKNHEPSIILDKVGLAVDTSPIPMSKESNVKKVETYMDGVDQVLSNEILTIGRDLKTEEANRKILELEHDLKEQNKANMKVNSKSISLRYLAHELLYLSS